MAKVPRIIWLASYPKSGNTWVRFLLANLLFGRLETAEKLQNLIPDIHWGLDLREFSDRDRIFVKTHWKFDQEMSARQLSEKFIYVVRNPLDVLVSNLNFKLMSGYDFIQEMEKKSGLDYRESFIEKFIANLGDPKWRQIGYGSWAEHLESWLGGDIGFPGLTVHYEDLLADTRKEVSRICDFLAIDASDPQIDQAIACSSFDSMRGVEEADRKNKKSCFLSQKTWESGRQAGFSFMNRGQAGDARRQLSSAQLERAMRAFQPVLQKHGLERYLAASQ